MERELRSLGKLNKDKQEAVESLLDYLGKNKEGAFALCGAVGGRAGDWEWLD